MDSLLDLKSGMLRIRYVFEKHGICGRVLRVTPHGLRHQYAAQHFQSLTGQTVPVLGGASLEKELDTQARLQIAEELGHGCVQISNAYLGSAVRSRI